MVKDQVKAVKSIPFNTRLRVVRDKLKRTPKLSYNGKTKPDNPKSSASWDNWTHFDQFGKWV